MVQRSFAISVENKSVKTICYSIIIFCLSITSLCCDERKPLNHFDKLITKNTIEANHGKEFLFEIKNDKKNVKSYHFIYKFNKKNPYHHYICIINVGEAGVFIQPDEYKKEYSQIKADYIKQNPKNWELLLEKDFPDIGYRAQMGPVAAGPGGSAYSLRLTTSDMRFDIEIVISNLLPDDVENPDLDIWDIAKKISNRYDNLIMQNKRKLND